MSSVARLLARGSGPARARAQAREQTLALRRAAAQLLAEQARAARLAGAKVPESVLGGDLLGLLSEPLQALLRAEAPGPTADEAEAGRRDRLDAPTSPPKQRPAYRADGVPGQGTLRAGMNGSNGQEKHRRGLGSGLDPNAPGGHRPPAAAPEAQYLVSADFTSTGGTAADVERAGRPERRDGAARAKRPTAAALLAREVDEYFQPAPASASEPARVAPAPRPVPPGEAGTPSTIHRPGDAMADPTGALPGRNWPRLSGHKVAERLQAFVSGSLPPEPGHAAATNAGGRQVEINNTFNIQVGPGTEGGGTGEAALLDLSDQVAEILRQQAIQHGIDVT